MDKFTSRMRPMLSNWKIPRDGTRRYLYDIWQPLLILLTTVCFTAAFFATYNPYALTNPDDLFFCNADGNVEVVAVDYRPFWDSRLYFTINIAFGQFAFSTAKIIDAGWDVVVGRGGQMVAAVVAYRTIRRSLTLTMETCTVAIPTVTSLYCRQVQLVPMGHLVRNMFWHWGSVDSIWRKPFHSGRIRLGMQVFACVYVLTFATIVSVMTGYRAQLTGYFGYDTESDNQLQPISELSRPGMVLLDGNRIGLSDSPLYAARKTVSPAELLDSTGYYNVSDLLDSSRDFEEPFGTLIDYYHTCSGVAQWAYYREFRNESSYTLECARHECACYIRRENIPVKPDGDIDIRYSTIVDGMESNITFNGERRKLGAPPLTIGSASRFYVPHYPSNTTFANAHDYWSDSFGILVSTMFKFTNQSNKWITTYTNNNNVPVDEGTVTQTGRCIAQDAYSWGFSSLLLLTFCAYTLVFALTLIILQTDVYWNSRYDRIHQSHSIYTDVLYLAEELKATFGANIDDHMQSARRFEKMVESWKQGLCLEVQGLPPSRWLMFQEQWRSRMRRLRRRGRDLVQRAPQEYADSLDHELRPVTRQKHLQLGVLATAGRDNASEPASTPSLQNLGNSDQTSVLREAGVLFAATNSSVGASVAEEQALIAGAARDDLRLSTDEAGHEAASTTGMSSRSGISFV